MSLDPNNIADDRTNLWLDERTVEIAGKQLEIKSHDCFQSKTTDFIRFFYSIGNTIIIISKGTPSVQDINQSVELLTDLFKPGEKYKKFNIIWDMRGITDISIKVRKAIIRANSTFHDVLDRKYIIVTERLRTLIYIYKIIKPELAAQVSMAESTWSAFQAIVSQETPEPFKVSIPTIISSTREELMEMDKEQLVEQILSSNKKHEDNVYRILETIGRITWDGDFTPTRNHRISDSDPECILADAMWVLQKDAFEIIQELRDLNQNLEKKVSERILDIIDKESNLRAILDNSDGVTWLINQKYELIDYNTAFIKEIYYKRKIEPKIGQNVLDLIEVEKPMNEGVWKQRFDLTLDGKPGIYLDQDIYKGEERVLEIKTFPIREVEKIKGVSVFVHDITELKRSQLKLIDKNRDLEKVNKELDSFVYRVSHDLRAPLTSILGLLNLMKIETDPEKIIGYIDLQEKSVKRLDLFIKDIINLSRNARLGITVERINFEEMINNIVHDLSYTDSATLINKRLYINDSCPFYSDKNRIHTILNNLISNSIKYSNVKQEDPFIEITVNSDEEQCEIIVKDNGIGISELHLPKIWTMFFRATNDNQGSGLGLYIVKETVDKLKGKISVKSKTRVGTTFKIKLPNSKGRYEAAAKMI